MELKHEVVSVTMNKEEGLAIAQSLAYSTELNATAEEFMRKFGIEQVVQEEPAVEEVSQEDDTEEEVTGSFSN